MFNFGNNQAIQRLGKRLEQEQILTRAQVREVLERAKQDGRPLLEVLAEHATGSSDRWLDLVGSHFELPTVRLRSKVMTPYVLQLLPKDVAERHGIVVFKKTKKTIHVATVDPANDQTIEFVRRHTGFEPEVYLTTPDDLQFALSRYRLELADEFSSLIEDSLRETTDTAATAEDLAQHVPIITMVNSILDRGIAQGASDIHLEPGTDQLTIRFRIDGVLRKIVDVPKVLLPPLLARIKLMAHVKLDEHRIPQDGRFAHPVGARQVAIRVSVVPTLHGSKVVMRLLDAKRQLFTLRQLGLNQRDYLALKSQIAKPNGLLLVTGPTGSGKTTTLYTLLRMLNTEEVNICTIEDPIEYGLDGVNQTQVNPAAGLSFANGLRSLLRQDPNVIMVGEIRDGETADIAVNAAMTGHLVLSTLHTNSAAQTIQRLIEMGVQPYLAASTINMMIAQRLVRKVCPHCRVEIRLFERSAATGAGRLDLAAIIQKLIGLDLVDPNTDLSSVKVPVGRGCDKCQDSGYLGRVAIYELIPMTDDIHAAIVRDPRPQAISDAAVRNGNLTMAEDGILKMLHGLTTLEEVIRVTS